MRSPFSIALVTIVGASVGGCSSSPTPLRDGGILRDAAQSAGDAALNGSDAAPAVTDDSAEGLCVATINMYRATLGLPAYTRLNAKESCAATEAQSDSMTGTAHGAFGQCGEFAQNECPDWPAPPAGMIKNCLAQMWAEGPGSDFPTHGHYTNMSSTSYTKVSCGFYSTGKNTVWAVQNFE